MEFYKELRKVFTYYDMWNNKDNRPTAGTSPHLLTQNIPTNLRWIYEHDKTAITIIEIFFKIFSAYMNGTALVKRIALTELITFQPTIDQVKSLSQYENLILKAESSIGTDGKLSVRDLAELLYVSKLPAEYEVLVTNYEINELNFASLSISLRNKSEFLQTQTQVKPNKQPLNQAKIQPKKHVNQFQPSDPVSDSLWVDPATHNCIGHDESKCFIALNLVCTKCKEAGFKFQHPTDHVRYCRSKRQINPVTLVSPSVSTTPNNQVNQVSTAPEAALDSACYGNLSNNKGFFDLYTKSTSSISSCTGSPSDIVGKGKLIIPTTVGMGRIDGEHCPDLEQNLLSVSYFDKKGYTSIFGGGKVHLIATDKVKSFVDENSANILLTGKFKPSTGLYMVPLLKPADMPQTQPQKAENTVSLTSKPKRDLMDWHIALNHLNFASVRQMVKVVEGMEISDADKPDPDCKTCLLGKPHHAPYKSSLTKLSRAGEIISTDVWHSPIATSEGFRYYILFTDHYTKYRWLHLVKSMKEIPESCIHMLNRLENILNRPVGTFRVDQQTGYTCHKLKNYLSEKGIADQETCTDAHQQNGACENSNKIIPERIRCMLLHSSLPPQLWGEAALNVIVTLNVSGHRSLNGMTPYEKWNGHKPKVSHLRMFGEPCFPMIMQKDWKSKLEPRASNAVFVGYDNVKKAYRCYESASDSIILTPTVNFQKTVRWKEPVVVRYGDIDHEDLISTNYHHQSEISPDPPVLNEALPNKPKTSVSSSLSNENIISGKRQRTNKPVYSISKTLITTPAPLHFNDIKNRSDSTEWYEALEKEMEGLRKNDFAILVPPPADKSKILHPSTRFTRKNNGMAKARICAADKRQPYEDKTYAPVATDTSFKLLCVMSAKMGLKIRQWDINQAFLHAEVKREVYVRQAKGTIDPLHPTWVWKLKKSLYGLKEAALLWFEELSGCLLSEGFVKSPGDNCLFAKFGDGYIILINLHVDDFAISHNNNDEYEKLKNLIHSKYGLKDGPLLHFLHYDCFQDLDLKQIILTQQSVISEILDRANMQNCTPSKSIGTVPMEFPAPPTPEEESKMVDVPYRELLGMLNQVATHTRPDIQPVVITLSRFLSSPRLGHWIALKQLLRYLKQTYNYGLVLGHDSDAPLMGYSDASYNSCPVTCRSVGGYIIQYNDSTISWSSKWFKGIFPSSMETEYAAVFEAVTEALWIRKQIEFILQKPLEGPTTIYVDNEAAIKYSRSKELKGRLKHMNVKLHFTREKVESKEITLIHIYSKDNVADMMTKTIKGAKLKQHLAKVGLRVC
jgi:hypothetical protein